jgi:CheY-like chemotaxis protein
MVEMIARLLENSTLIETGPFIEKRKKQKEIITRHTIVEEAKHSIHILLAEDNLINQKLAHFMLSKAGYLLTIVKNGEEAVDTFTSEPGKFHMIFMDIQMPQMDGLDATRTIREKGFTDIPIIAMTAQTMKGDREKCLKAGMDDYIAKPIKREVVFSMVKKWCLDKA